MEKVFRLFKRESNIFNFSKIVFNLISPELIEARSYGIVKKPETINYRSYKPERDGLFCAKIFGPIKDYECLCGKYKRFKHRGIICEKCGVEVTFSKVRRSRMAHIELACPIAHIWFFRTLPSRLGLLLNLTIRDLEKVLYYESYIVVSSKIEEVCQYTILDKYSFIKYSELYGDLFVAKMGAEAILELLTLLDLKALSLQLKNLLKENLIDTKVKRIKKRLQLVEMFLLSGNKPEWMILTVLPVLPPELRPLVPLEGGRFASSDLNDLYRRVINRNNRLKRLLELRAPDIIIRNEKRMLQEAVDALFENGKRGKPVLNTSKRPLKSLSDIIKGKYGRFRQNLLGKRVDYSGRSVIVVGPFLKLHQCGLPKQMALELFKPFILSRLELNGIANIKLSKKLIEEGSFEVYSILNEVVAGYPILLNRAPTLHRLGIQAFEPILIDSKAIQLHPLVCVAFNADFDGDQMAVHIPLSIEAQLEARVLLLSINNFFSPANGYPIIIPSQDILLGLYYLTIDNFFPLSNFIFFNVFDVYFAYESNLLDIHTKILLYLKENNFYTCIETTVGRVLFYKCCPSHLIDFKKINKIITKDVLIELITYVYKILSRDEVALFCDDLMRLGFQFSTLAGISICITDFNIPKEKVLYVKRSVSDVKVMEKQYSLGLLTPNEKHNRIIDLWFSTIENVSNSMLESLSLKRFYFLRNFNDCFIRIFNSVYLMLYSGARGSLAQLRQLGGMRGLMTKPDGSILETPIISNFREGLNVLQYFISIHGSRKGLIDTALKTANSGYLTRRLVDAAQDVRVVQYDCGVTEGISMSALVVGGDIVLDLSLRIFGRVLCQDVFIPGSDIVLIKSGSLVLEKEVELLKEYNVNTVVVRSVVMCLCSHGVCSICYGIDLSRGSLVNKGESVGVIAAQSIGEPGTQLTMRTFHVGGVVSQKVGSGLIRVKNTGVVKFYNIKTVVNKELQHLVVSKYGFVSIVSITNRELERYTIPQGAELFFRNEESINCGNVLALWNPHVQPIIAEVSGKIKYVDLILGVTVEIRNDELTGIPITMVVDAKNVEFKSVLNPSIEIFDVSYELQPYQGTFLKVHYTLSPGTLIDVSDGVSVHVGDVIARSINKLSEIRDITGGLPKIVDLFEARVPKKNPAVLAVSSGTVSFFKEKKGKTAVIIIDSFLKKNVMYLSKFSDICIYEGEFVKKGDVVVEGVLNPHDLLALGGISKVVDYLLTEVQTIYRAQGVNINDKHTEVILRQMLSKVFIIDRGDSFFRDDQIVDFDDVCQINKKLAYENKKIVKFSRLLLGITKVSLLTNSFISAASFQETTKVLVDAAIVGKSDFLHGLKENVIVGRLIPAGTGSERHTYKANSDVDTICSVKNYESDSGSLLDNFNVSEIMGFSFDGSI